jgi:hypothetical protein
MLTPYHEQLASERRERLARISARAVPDTPIVCRSASERRGVIPYSPTIAFTLPEQLPAPKFAAWLRRQARKNPLPAPMSPTPQVAKIISIQDTVARFYLMTRRTLVAHSHNASRVRTRQIAMYLARTITGASYPKIGKAFSGRDHATVLYSVSKIADLIKKDLTLANEIDQLRKLITGETI